MVCISCSDINCTAVEQEYNTERKRCQEIFTPCMIKDLKCSVQEFCSDECRDIYHKILQCSNGTAHRLDYLNLYCAVSNDPNHQNSSCIDLLLTRLRNSQGVYGYDTMQMSIRGQDQLVVSLHAHLQKKVGGIQERLLLYQSCHRERNDARPG